MRNGASILPRFLITLIALGGGPAVPGAPVHPADLAEAVTADATTSETQIDEPAVYWHDVISLDGAGLQRLRSGS